MFSSLLLATALTTSIHASTRSDTIPTNHTPTFKNQGEWEAYEIQQLFHDHYKPQRYALFEGTQVTSQTYRFGLLTLRIDSVPDGITSLLSRGLLYPGLPGPIFGPIDTLSLWNIVELKALSPSSQIRRFTCWVSNLRMANPISYAFELTNPQGTSNMDLAVFIRNARLTFLYQVGIII